ncbi:MAG: DEAD/DEAH box helicase family protein [Polyangiaceae bacterium]|nr:DEAD/DEAH box helicase family protein [Polyangiaceae bacterium]
MSLQPHPVHGLLRSHQHQALLLARKIFQRQRSSKVSTAHVVPGGGKTLMASLFAHELLGAGVVDNVLVVVPRDALRHQMRAGFTCEARGLGRSLLVNPRQSLRQRHAYENAAGYVVTYQALLAPQTRNRLRKLMGQGRWLLILDEPHHLAESPDPDHPDSARWTAALRPLFEAATEVLAMSGTLRRHDRQRIPFVLYGDDRRPVIDIEYSRHQALAEKATLPTTFVLMDGSVSWMRREQSHTTQLSEATDRELSDAVRTALSEGDFRKEWLLQALNDWLRYRSAVYTSRAIVICHKQSAAMAVAKAIREALHLDVALAISDAPDAQRQLQGFRERREGEVLVTVGMAYEGLDVPDCTHLVCLSNITSEPWLEQAFNRVTRFNPRCHLSWEKQHATVYVLDHARMRTFVNRMNDEQDLALREQPSEVVSVQPQGPSSFEALDAQQGEATIGVAGKIFSREESHGIERAMREFPALMLVAPGDILPIADRCGFVAARGA